MNLKLRLKNRPVLVALAAAAVAFVYQVLGILNVVPPVSQEQTMNIIGLILNILVGVGVLVDPTTAGLKDSARAMTYDRPNEVTEPDETFPVGGENAGDNDAAHELNDPADPEV